MHQPGRSQALDVLRGIAVLLVIGRHLPPCHEWLKPAMDVWQCGGWTGVDLFFVLSGFLVSGLIFREHQEYGVFRPLRFLGRRGFKIYPAFYFFLCVPFLKDWGQTTSLLAQPEVRYSLAAEACFVQNYFYGLFRHTWSLAVEEHFYLLLSVLLAVLVRVRRQEPFAMLPRLIVWVLVSVLIMRAVNFAVRDKIRLHTHLYATHLRLDSLLFGVLLSYYYHYRPAELQSWYRRHRAIILIASPLLVAPAFVLSLADSRLIYTAGLTMLYLGYAGFLLAAIYDLNLEKRSWPVRICGALLAFIGFFSYSIYLWHTFALSYVAVFADAIGLELTHARFTVIGCLMAVLVGWLAARIIEIPFLRLRDRLLPSRSTARTTAVVVAPADSVHTG